MYFDPNTGGMLFQIFLVLFGVFSAIILIFSGKVRGIFAKLRRKMHEQGKLQTSTTGSDDEIPPPAA